MTPPKSLFAIGTPETRRKRRRRYPCGGMMTSRPGHGKLVENHSDPPFLIGNRLWRGLSGLGCRAT
jgi:hypothetical protein